MVLMSISTLSSVSHVCISIAALSLILFFMVYAVLFFLQRQALKQRPLKMSLISLLPSLESSEERLGKILLIGFLALSAALATGISSNTNMMNGLFDFKIASASLAWLLFAMLLYSHKKFGIRGIKTSIWASIGILILVLTYISHFQP